MLLLPPFPLFCSPFILLPIPSHPANPPPHTPAPPPLHLCHFQASSLLISVLEPHSLSLHWLEEQGRTPNKLSLLSFSVLVRETKRKSVWCVYEREGVGGVYVRGREGVWCVCWVMPSPAPTTSLPFGDDKHLSQAHTDLPTCPPAHTHTRTHTHTTHSPMAQ